MSSTFKFHSTVGEAVPWNATYSFPSQGTKVYKSIVKIPTKQNTTYNSTSNSIKIDFPADGYINMQNSVLQFDVTWNKSSATRICLQRGGAHNYIKRLIVRYGGLVLEDIQEYKTLVRLFTEVGVQKDYAQSYGSILDGMHTDRVSLEQNTLAEGDRGFTAGAVLNNINGVNTGAILDEYFLSELDILTLNDNLSEPSQAPVTRTYCLNLLSGLMTCKKLIPLKWMGSQFAIEIYLAPPGECALYNVGSPEYTISNMNFIAEILDFDSSYDKAFYMGLQAGGIPIKFTSFHHFQFNLNSPVSTLQIHERSRSIKSAYAVIRENLAGGSGAKDSDWFYHSTAAIIDGAGILQNSDNGQVQEFQWRIGGKYFPAQPVRCTNGGAEAMVELLKTLNYLGNYTAAGNIDIRNFTHFNKGKGNKFIMACEFENTDALPDTIAGINGEEQSDIALIIKAQESTPINKKVDVFTHYDCLLMIKEGNVVELIL